MTFGGPRLFPIANRKSKIAKIFPQPAETYGSLQVAMSVSAVIFPAHRALLPNRKSQITKFSYAET